MLAYPFNTYCEIRLEPSRGESMTPLQNPWRASRSVSGYAVLSFMILELPVAEHVVHEPCDWFKAPLEVLIAHLSVILILCE